ncbi:polysaccharide deacetylase family protein [Streptomyces bluensis]|uniref:Lipoprotein n=1 Tax=Streptomyces bluensis TaxID=33897 RepID=A0ABW6UAE6_9ACTN
MDAPHRIAAGAALVAVCSAALAGCVTGDTGARTDGGVPREGAHGPKRAVPAPAPKDGVRLIGDGSTAYTGPQPGRPGQPGPERLAPGRKPPQFVVFSWDGAGEDSQRLFSRFRKVARANNATMTYFLSGVYMLPGGKRELYRPPRHAPGSSDIGFNDIRGIRDTVAQLRGAWLEGNEIGTHFNGHFCGPGGGVDEWSVDDWKSEIAQAKAFVKSWKTNTGLAQEEPLPFDYDRELVGARTPCLEGQRNFVRAAAELGFRYDTSGVTEQVWPKKKGGLWELSMQMVPVPGRDFETLTMDYNFYASQSRARAGDPAMHTYWGNQYRDGLLKGFERAFHGNRAPLIIGNHFESWNGGAYMRAVEETIKAVCTRAEVRCVSFRQLADWLDAQDPETLDRLRTLEVGEAPARGWSAFLAGGAASAPKGVPGALRPTS